MTGGGESGTDEHFPPLPLGLLRVLRPAAGGRPAPLARDTVAATRTGEAPALRPRASGVGAFRGRPARGGLFSAMCSSASAARGLADADSASLLPAPVPAAEPAPAAPPAVRLSADARTARENDAADDCTYAWNRVATVAAGQRLLNFPSRCPSPAAGRTRMTASSNSGPV